MAKCWVALNKNINLTVAYSLKIAIMQIDFNLFKDLVDKLNQY